MEVIKHNLNTMNLHPAERWASIVGGGALVISGIERGRRGIVRTVVGAAMLQRGLTGHCLAYQVFGVRTRPSKAAVPYELGVRARATVTIARPREKIFEFWQQLENLPRFMRHLVSVEPLGEKRSRWTARGPMDKHVTWDAEIINEVPDELIAWKSLPGSDVDSAGSVRFQDAPGGRGTEIRVELQYSPPAGVVGAYVARLFGREPEQEIAADLGRLKQFLESGEIATTQGQAQGGKPSDSIVSKTLEEAIP